MSKFNLAMSETDAKKPAKLHVKKDHTLSHRDEGAEQKERSQQMLATYVLFGVAIFNYVRKRWFVRACDKKGRGPEKE
ncbi:hypothetical protein CYMTET_29574 [Cymbomonas tetramitiformis]|uniref:Uncharacterized protein n=1 Tax=Cymbomonas tetramitiformis TaxID=36881 RepID=A0AAE0FKT3_9CHLO|nr:hypothetical protein CYMTET_29574 [Cymbomonas tetramitiformis]